MNRKTRRSIGLRIPVWGDKPVPDHQVKDSGRRKNPRHFHGLSRVSREAERATRDWRVRNGTAEPLLP